MRLVCRNDHFDCQTNQSTAANAATTTAPMTQFIRMNVPVARSEETGANATCVRDTEESVSRSRGAGPPGPAPLSNEHGKGWVSAGDTQRRVVSSPYERGGSIQAPNGTPKPMSSASRPRLVAATRAHSAGWWPATRCPRARLEGRRFFSLLRRCSKRTSSRHEAQR
jgi:hypothetical protein